MKLASAAFLVCAAIIGLPSAAGAITCDASNSCTAFGATAGPISFTNLNQPAAVYVTAAPSAVYYFNAQNPLGSQGHEDQGIETFLGLGSLPASVNSKTFSGDATGGTLTGNANVFAIHFDHQELLIVYASGISSFTLSGLGNGDLSNIQSFCDLASCTPHTTGDPPGQTPVPAALPLFAGGLALFSLLRRRRKQTIEMVLA